MKALTNSAAACGTIALPLPRRRPTRPATLLMSGRVAASAPLASLVPASQQRARKCDNAGREPAGSWLNCSTDSRRSDAASASTCSRRSRSIRQSGCSCAPACALRPPLAAPLRADAASRRKASKTSGAGKPSGLPAFPQCICSSSMVCRTKGRTSSDRHPAFSA